MNATSAPDAIQPIRAWRVWAGSPSEDGDLVLRSLTDAGGGTCWPAGEVLHARCVRGTHPAPSAACTCGIYAHRTWRAAVLHARSVAGSIIGEVELWGRVVEHEHGYRSEYARPCALWVSVAPDAYTSEEHHVTAALARRSALSGYGVSTGVVHSQTGLALDLAELRSVFIRDPTAPRPLRDLLPSIVWGALRVMLIFSSAIVAGLAAMAAFAAVVVIGLLLPFTAGGAAYDLVGQGGPGVALGVAAWLALVAVYLVIADRFDLFDKANDL